METIRGNTQIKDDTLEDVAWTNYGATSTVVGWSSTTQKVIYYKKVGKLVFVTFAISGTSDSASTSFTLPYAVSNLVQIDLVIRAVDSGSYIYGLMEIGASSVANFYTTLAGVAWTASGTKTIIGQFWYESA